MAADSTNREPVKPRAGAPEKRKRRRRPGPLLLAVTIAYAAALLAISVANLAGPDRWWPGSLNLYVPQGLWALPIVVLLPWYLVRARSYSWIPILLAAWVFGPIMGWLLGLARIGSRTDGHRIRVMTYNVKWGERNAEGVISNIVRADPDILLMQDSNYALDNKLNALRELGWNHVELSQYTVMSRFPISNRRQLSLGPELRDASLSCVVHIGDRTVTLLDAHLITPRMALGAVADNGAEGAGDMQANVSLRSREADALAAQVREIRGPLILTGDLNAPVQSRVCQTLFGCGLRDAFSESGWGYGYTYGQSTFVRAPYVRIDHILVSPEWSVLRCAEGSPRGSDHSPVIADLALPDAR